MSETLTYTVTVVSDGEPQSGVAVTVFLNFPMLPSDSFDRVTDEDGQVSIEYEHAGFPFSPPEEIEIYVYGTKYGPYDCSDGDGFTVDLESDD